jgi:hypothetical protein
MAIQKALIRQLGVSFQRPRLAVVIGRRPDEPGDLFDLRTRVRQLPLRIELITYDDVLGEEAQRILLQLSLGANP